jgi:hypothetical protein
LFLKGVFIMHGLRNIKLIGGFVLLFFVLGLFSCSKKSDETSHKDTSTGEAELVTVSDKDFNESDEDLLTVDYKEFYDELAPHGEWIEVTDKDIGVNMSGTASGISPVRTHKSFSFSDFFGVKEAHATDASFGAFFVWKPAPNLAIGLTTGATEPEPYYQPYTNGQWVYTDAGWYFRAATPVEEVTHHYGRWVYSPMAGWVWVPGRVWAPAWVDWREDDTYLAWSPVPPSVYIVNNVVVVPPPVVVEERYVIVEKRYFVEPMVYKYMYKEHKGKIKIKEWRRLDGVMVVNNTVIDKGPDVSIIQSVIGRNITTVQIDRVNSINKVEFTDTKIKTYAPEFKKVKDKGSRKNPFSKPDKYNTFASVSGEKDKQNNSGDVKQNNESSGKQYDNKGSEKNNKTRLSDDGNMKNGKNNNNQNKGNEKKGSDNKDNKNKGNDNKGNDNKGKDKVKDNKGNDNKGNDNKGGKDKKKFSSDNSNDNKDSKNKGNNDKGNKDGKKKFRNDNSNDNKGGKDKGNNDKGNYNGKGNKDDKGRKK